MSNKSNWDESRDAKAGPGAGEDGEGNSDFAQSVSHAEHADSSQDSTQEEPARKKSNPMLPKILVGVMGLLVVGVIGFFAMRIMNAGSGGAKKAASRPPVSQMSTAPMDQAPTTGGSVGKGSVLMGEDKSTTAAAVAVAVSPVAPVAAVVPASAAAEVQPVAPTPTVLPPAATMPDGTYVPPTPAAARDPAAALPDTRLNEANARVRSLEEETRVLREQLAQRSVTPITASPSDRVARPHRIRSASTASLGGAARPAHPAASRPSKGRKAPSMIIETEEPEVPREVARLQLRGVYPRGGADMQAWIMDGEKTLSVSRGSVINGAKVIRVEIDRVVTDKGAIR